MRSPISFATLLTAILVAGCYRQPASSLTSEAEPAAAIKKYRLAPPVQLEIDGNPLEAGYPFLGDIDGDGRLELLMGGDPNGRLLVYRNVGDPAAPRLAEPKWFDDWVPTGRIPKG